MNQRKVRRGIVVSDKMSKTRVVEIVRSRKHPLYGKVLYQKKHYYAHDEGNATHRGDRVEIEESRPLSRLKRWRIKRVI